MSTMSTAISPENIDIDRIIKDNIFKFISSMNKCNFIGRIASDLEIRTTQGGDASLAFRLAVPRPYKDKSGERPTDFIPCVAWRQKAEFIHKFFHKGDKVGLSGSLQIRSYQGQDGFTRYAHEIIIDDIEGCASAQGRPQAAEQQEMNNGFVPIADDDKLPF